MDPPGPSRNPHSQPPPPFLPQFTQPPPPIPRPYNQPPQPMRYPQGFEDSYVADNAGGPSHQLSFIPPPDPMFAQPPPQIMLPPPAMHFSVPPPPITMDPTTVEPLMQQLTLDSQKKQEPKKPKPYVSHFYDINNGDLPVFGVVVMWERQRNFKRPPQGLLKELEALRAEESTKKPLPKLPNVPREKGELSYTLKRKPLPYLRRLGPQKATVYFADMFQANSFVQSKQGRDFYAFIPLSYVTVVAAFMANRKEINFLEFQKFCKEHPTIMHWRKKLREDKKVLVTLAYRGTKLPEKLVFNGQEYKLDFHVPPPVLCERCLRYGHRKTDCMKKPRCGVCVRTKPFLKHMQVRCTSRFKVIQDRCFYCLEDHDVGKPECSEQKAQRLFKQQLVKRKMDFLTVLENDIIKGLRATRINSVALWMDPQNDEKNEEQFYSVAS
ncbi:uncharacterized protein LOC129744825 [Uranotaenia lowii]|uniref:uncharacterized protein LOC129744825 n=1 Tax=Uranotaenia lowii TaxID=190385 RepID=UPI00247B0DE8|nr:uncharacterized protein LOC129744825 [Uranotaenia lowii]XP_055593522.1 uncharacterized protein LOC129744825 [Uranotaenia lowii]